MYKGICAKSYFLIATFCKKTRFANGKDLERSLYDHGNLLAADVRMVSAGEIVSAGRGKCVRERFIGADQSAGEKRALHRVRWVSLVDEAEGGARRNYDLGRTEKLVLEPHFIRSGCAGIFFLAGEAAYDGEQKCNKDEFAGRTHE